MTSRTPFGDAWRSALSDGVIDVIVVIKILLLLSTLGLLGAVLLQKSKGEGLGAIGGSAQMFFDQPKGVDAALDRATTICAVGFMLFSLLLTILS